MPEIRIIEVPGEPDANATSDARRKEEDEQVELIYEGPGPQPDLLNYRDMAIVQQKWPRTGVSWWFNVLMVAVVVFSCVAVLVFAAFLRGVWP